MNNHYFTAVGPGMHFKPIWHFQFKKFSKAAYPETPIEELQNFFSALRASKIFWDQPATLPDKILDQRLFLELKSLGGRVKVELDLSNYATKADLKNANRCWYIKILKNDCKTNLNLM